MFRFGTSLFVSILCFAGTSAMAKGTEQPTDPQIAPYRLHGWADRN
jgi:hypothetical protein